jgi:hypothetical protein
MRAASIAILIAVTSCNVDRALPGGDDGAAGAADLAPANDLGARDAVGGASDLTQPPPDLSNAHPRTWRQLIGPGVWMPSSLARTAAIDSHETLYVTNGSDVFAVSMAGVASVYASANEIDAADATPGGTGVIGLDVGPDDQLYILTLVHVLVSAGAGQVAQLRPVPNLPLAFSVLDANRILVVDYTGLQDVTPAGAQLVYGKSMLMGGNNCGGEYLAVQRDGVFFYSPGCLNSPMMRGQAGGGGVAVVLAANLKPTVNADTFDCVTRAPTGGFVISATSTMGTANAALIQSDESGQWTEIVSQPSMFAYESSLGSVILFDGRPVEVGASGAIYIVALDTIHVLSP